MTPGYTVLLHSLRRSKVLSSQPYPRGGEVFVISGGRFCRQALENQQVEFRRLADEAGQQGVDLPGAEPRDHLVKPVIGPRVVVTEHPMMRCVHGYPRPCPPLKISSRRSVALEPPLARP